MIRRVPVCFCADEPIGASLSLLVVFILRICTDAPDSDLTGCRPVVQPLAFSVRLTGWIKAPRPGRYKLITNADDGVRLWFDGKLLIDEWHTLLSYRYETEVDLSDQPHAIRVEYYEIGGGAALRLLWQQKGGFPEQVVPAACLFHDREAAIRPAARFVRNPPFAAGSKPQVAIPWGEWEKEGHVWRYTTSQLGVGWEGAGFRDASWKTGASPFGKGPRDLKIGTAWDSQDIWLRTTVELPALTKAAVALPFFHDDDIEIYVNGKELLRRASSERYQDYYFNEQERALFRTGLNTIAVHCRNRGRGDQGVDVGLEYVEGAEALPFRISMNGLAGMQFVDALAPPQWHSEGVFARILGQETIRCSAVPSSRYVLETEVELHTKNSWLKFKLGDPSNAAELWFEWDQERQKVHCRLMKWRNGWVVWGGGRHFDLGERLPFKLVVVDNQQTLFYEDKPILGTDAWPADLQIQIESRPSTVATIHRLACRELREEDVKHLKNRGLPVAIVPGDPVEAARRLNERKAGYADRPNPGMPFHLPQTDTAFAWIPPGEFEMGSRNP